MGIRAKAISRGTVCAYFPCIFYVSDKHMQTYLSFRHVLDVRVRPLPDNDLLPPLWYALYMGKRLFKRVQIFESFLERAVIGKGKLF